MATLLIKFKNELVDEIVLGDKPITIGRVIDNDIVIDNLGVSRKHARISREGNSFILEDLGSENGTFITTATVSELRLESKCKIRHRDQIFIGKHTLVFMQHDDPEFRKQFTRGIAKIVPTKLRMKTLRPPLRSKFLPPEETLFIGADDKRKTAKMGKEQLMNEPECFGRVKILGEGDKTIEEIKFHKPLITAGKGGNDIFIDGEYEPNVVFIISNRPTGFFIAPTKGVEVWLDRKQIEKAAKMRTGSVITAYETRLKFFSK